MIIRKQKQSDGFLWVAESPDPISEYMAQCLQVKGEYHPAGYGFYNFKCEEKDGKYVATWNCGDSCD